MVAATLAGETRGCVVCIVEGVMANGALAEDVDLVREVDSLGGQGRGSRHCCCRRSWG